MKTFRLVLFLLGGATIIFYIRFYFDSHGMADLPHTFSDVWSWFTGSFERVLKTNKGKVQLDFLSALLLLAIFVYMWLSQFWDKTKNQIE